MKSKILSLVTLLTIITLFTISSCSDDEGDEQNSSIVGTWVLIQNIDSECDDPADNFNEMVTCNANDCITIIFRADNTFETIELEDGITFNTDGEYLISGSSLTLTGMELGIAVSSSLSFTLENDRLTIIDNTFDSECTFTTIFERR